MSEVIIIVLLVLILVFLLSISVQLAKVIRLLIVIALKADYVAAKKAAGQND